MGEAVHKGQSYPGEHEAIVSNTVWKRVQDHFGENPRQRSNATRAQTPALLKGLIFGPDGSAMSPTHTRKGQRLYRYYVSQRILKDGAEACPGGRVAAGEIEAAVIDQLRVLLRSPEIVVATWKAARKEAPRLTEADVRDALFRFDPLWNELFPAEQARIVRLLVRRVDLGMDQMEVRLCTDGLEHLLGEIGSREAA